MKGWLVSHTGDKWTVEDIWTPLIGARGTTLGYRIAAVVLRVPSVSVLPLDFSGKLWVLRTMNSLRRFAVQRHL